MSERKFYTISVLTENSPGILQRVTTAFTKRKINIESLTVSETALNGTSIHTITIWCDPDTVATIVKQLERVVEVRSATASEDAALISREIAMIRVAFANQDDLAKIEEHASRYAATIIYVDSSSAIVQTVGTEDSTQALYRLLQNFEVKEFIRSGRIALMKKKTD